MAWAGRQGFPKVLVDRHRHRMNSVSGKQTCLKQVGNFVCSVLGYYVLVDWHRHRMNSVSSKTSKTNLLKAGWELDLQGAWLLWIRMVWQYIAGRRSKHRMNSVSGKTNLLKAGWKLYLQRAWLLYPC